MPMLQECQCHIIVPAVGRTPATAVAEKDGLVADVAQAQLADRQLLFLQRACLAAILGPFSPFALLCVAPCFVVHQCSDDLLQLALCEALEHVHDWVQHRTTYHYFHAQVKSYLVVL